jgi:integrase
MRVNAVLRKYKSKDGKQQVLIRVAYGKSKKYYSLGIRIPASNWDAKRQRVINCPNDSTMNAKILTYLAKIEQNFIKDGVINKEDNNSFAYWFRKRVEYSEMKHSRSRVRNFKQCMSGLFSFYPNLKVSDLTYSFLFNYEKHLIKIGNSANTIALKMGMIKTIVMDCLKSGVIDFKDNPFNHYKISIKKTNRQRLDISSIKKLEAFKTDNFKMQLAVDMYLFSFYCGGIRRGDLFRLTIENIKGGRLTYKASKVGRVRNLSMPPQAIAIANKYIGNNYFFVKLNESKWEQEVDGIGQIYNPLLKKACVICGITPVTYHTARHSLADYAVKSKANTRDLMHLLGHSKVNTTEIYIGDLGINDTDELQGKLFGG